MGSKLKVAGILAVGVVAGALTTMQLQAVARSGVAPLPLEEVQQLAAVFDRVKAEYVEPVDEKKLISDAITGMVAGLDPHSQYFDKKAFKEFRESTGGKFVGIGIEMGMEDGLVKVVSPIEGSPAFRAGLKSGDLITRIDDTPVKGLTVDQAVKKMRGDPNTKVVLSVYRKAESRTFTVTLVRDEIRMQSVRAKMLAPGYGWLRVSQFQDRTVEDFVRKIDELYKQDPNLKGLVLDLRNDPGGLLDGAVALAAAFLPSDVVVVTTNGQLPESRATFRASPDDYARRGGGDPLKRLPAALKSVPLVVLVNEASASASEIVAGALQDHKRAVVLGTQTFGKGSVQTVLPLSAKSAIKLTTARYYTPNGRSIQAKGIEPDIVVEETPNGSSRERLREADLDRHLANDKDGKAAEKPAAPKKEPAEKAPAGKNGAKDGKDGEKDEAHAKPFEPASKDDYQLVQAMNLLKALQVIKK